MKKVKTASATGHVLDWMAEKAQAVLFAGEGRSKDPLLMNMGKVTLENVVDRYRISLNCDHSGVWVAGFKSNYADEAQHVASGSSSMEAAKRALVRKALGDQVDVPTAIIDGKELIGTALSNTFVAHFGRVFNVVAWFPDTEQGTQQANDFMLANEGAALLVVWAGCVVLAHADDQGVKY